MTSISALFFLHIIGFSTVFFALHLLKNKIPYSVKGNILVSSLVSVAVGFRVGTVRASACQAAWYT